MKNLLRLRFSGHVVELWTFYTIFGLSAKDLWEPEWFNLVVTRNLTMYARTDIFLPRFSHLEEATVLGCVSKQGHFHDKLVSRWGFVSSISNFRTFLMTITSIYEQNLSSKFNHSDSRSHRSYAHSPKIEWNVHNSIREDRKIEPITDFSLFSPRPIEWR